MMIIQIGIESRVESSRWESRLCNGAMWREMSVATAATSRPENRLYISCGSEDVARVSELYRVYEFF